MKFTAKFAAIVLSATFVGGFAVTPASAHGRGHHRHYQEHQYHAPVYYRQNSRYDRYDRYDHEDRYDRRDYRHNRYNNRCSDGTGGTIVGAVAGGLIGDRVARRGSRTEGTIIGAAIGALGGRAIDKASSRCR